MLIRRKNKGKINIQYNDNEELQTMMRNLKKTVLG